MRGLYAHPYTNAYEQAYAPTRRHIHAQVTRGSQQLVPLTWMQARVMEALRTILTGQDPVTALRQVLLLDPAAHRLTSE
ncbi:hypothetical protein EVAR_5880_1 [Eumeta japonica]|uniref:Uncharacterized protein n=1 Tax=Eumeta variegata TaxID=151549 RepID=A0A4C1TBY5_EUMVA|nr:hypothetical protein EVAR_5880_1 [Eumeta japonica]